MTIFEKKTMTKKSFFNSEKKNNFTFSTKTLRMSYQHEHIPLLEPKQWYNQIANVYAPYHASLTQWDQAAIKKYLPRSLQWIHVLDLGGGDGRRAKLLQWMWFASRTIVDIAQSMLNNAPWWTKKICADLHTPLPIPSETYGLIISAFVLLHLDELMVMFTEARRCITPDWRMLLVHHYERRPFVHESDNGPVKIKTWHRRYEDIETALESCWWQVDVFAIDASTKIFCCFPSEIAKNN